ncbi:tRNA (adenosine(37)-N6)-threonylcarbamoyltransferase complex transferase subunit TsaD [Peptostreptococcaceae bacterium AGR-M142]
MKDIKVLAIESSCDETAASVILNGREILSNIVNTQMELHKKFGGVVPEVASRLHMETMNLVIKEALEKADSTFDDIDAIAVTYGPGLVGALLVGLSTAKALAFALQKPLVGVNHIEGHICANYISNKDLKPPFICLVVSGGHTHLVEVKDYNKYEILGRTRDDASGEAFDKIARALGLGYPGGPLIDKMAKLGDENKIDFPKALMDDDSYDFSFSGLKSAVLNYLNAKKMKKEEIVVEDVCASFQKAVVDVLSQKAIKACKDKNYNTLVLAGGVAANSKLRNQLLNISKKNNIKLSYPDINLCTDNAAMIGSCGYYNFINNKISDQGLNAVPNLKIGQE